MHDLTELYPYMSFVELEGGIRPLKWSISALLYAHEYTCFAGRAWSIHDIVKNVSETDAVLSLLYGAIKASDPSYTVETFLNEFNPDTYLNCALLVCDGLSHMYPEARPDLDEGLEDAHEYPEAKSASQSSDNGTDWRLLLVSAMRMGLSYTEFLNTSPRAIVKLSGVDEEENESWL